MRTLGLNRLQKSMQTLRPHGTRTRYQQGCRCFECRLVCAQYQRQRMARRKAGVETNDLVSAQSALDHMAMLSKAGIGLRTVSAVTDIHPWKLSEIRAGRVKHIRAIHSRKILAITEDMLPDGAHVPSDPVRQMITRLKREGFTYTELAKRIGVSRTVLVKRKPFVSARTRLKVQLFYERIMAEAA